MRREPLCRNEFCPEPRSPEWHECVVCGNPQVEHAHIISRSKAPSWRKNKNNVIALCHTHHELESLNRWRFHWEMAIEGQLHQWLEDEQGNVAWERDVGVSTAEGEGGVRAAGLIASLPSAAGASVRTALGRNLPASDASGTSDGKVCQFCAVAMTPASVPHSEVKP